MPNDSDDDTTAADAHPPEPPQRNPWPPLPEPFDVEHVTLSGGLFGGFDVMRTEYIDRSKPRRRNWLHRFLYGSQRRKTGQGQTDAHAIQR
jgi:hypothetical protein